ncbi:hypothetical protein [Desulfocucumis palustris]|uniref:hypothetical protein n=1 Tax=Desulfocucumis palustris TaxID=1898651 RepID=UPI0013FD3D57|nr:hypothetical protein [Desulfocucumis palustris]
MWIEILRDTGQNHTVLVAPYTGAWIEIMDALTNTIVNNVAPYTGVWIETCTATHQKYL